MSARGEPKIRYERLLRAIGAFLDEKDIQRFSIIEVPDGFTVMGAQSSEGAGPQEFHFPREQLLRNFEGLTRQGYPSTGQRGIRWRFRDSSRQDFLRALGHEMDDLRAQSVLVDELDDGILVSYSYVEPAVGYELRKKNMQLSPADIAAMLKKAYGRRDHPKR